MVGRSEIRKKGACHESCWVYIYACMARSVRSYVASVALKLASLAGTTSTCIGKFIATDIITR